MVGTNQLLKRLGSGLRRLPGLRGRIEGSISTGNERNSETLFAQNTF